MPSLADVSLQTGQSLLENDVVEKPQQLTKQTSTNRIPISTECHSLTTQTVDVIHPNVENVQTQETIKILKTTEGDHDVIEIATKNVPSTSTQEVVQECHPEATTEDIVVDMKYQDPTNTDNTTSELNIVHAAPQSFETVLVEPDDVTTEVVVDEDGSKRIIVRKLRRTTVTSRQTTQQHVSSTSTAIGDAPAVVQAFSEATMRDQRMTVSTAKPNGTIETTTRQIYGGRVTTGTPYKDVSVEEYESAPQYTHMVTQGHIRDISPQPFEEGLLMEGGEYRAQTSSVHAVVQQVTRRVVRKTRRIIRKVTIIDGKETATEEIIEEPEEVEIDEKNIPHISINVVKQEEQRQFGRDTGTGEGRTPERILVEEVTGKEEREGKESKLEEREVKGEKDEDLKMEEVTIDDAPMQGPFFGAFAKDMHPSASYVESRSLIDKEKHASITDRKEERITLAEKILEKPVESSVIDVQKEQSPERTPEESLSRIQPDDESSKPESVGQKVEPVDKYEHEHFLVEVKDKKSLPSVSQAFIDAEASAALQSPIGEVKIRETQAQEELAKSSIESIVSEDVASVTKATCKSVDAPVRGETPGIELEGRTLDVEKHDKDTRGTVDVLEGKGSREVSMETATKEAPDASIEDRQKTVHVSEEQIEAIPAPMESETHEKREALPIHVKQQIVKNSFVPEIDYSVDDYMDEALKPEYKPIFHRVEISLAVKKDGEEMQPTVSVKSQAEPEGAARRMVKEDVDISLPADKESKSIIHDKIVQTSPSLSESKIVSLDKSVGVSERFGRVLTSDKSVVTSEKEETDKSAVTSEKEETSDNVITSEKEDEYQTEPAIEFEEGTIMPLDEKTRSSVDHVSLASNIADSTEIDVTLSESSRRSEAPQPDIAKMLESKELELLSSKDGTSGGEDGYEADRTIVSTTTPDDEDTIKTKKKKKRKQRIRSLKDDEQTEFPKTTSDDEAFTDDLADGERRVESEDAKATKKKKKKKKRADVDVERSPAVALNETGAQTVPREFNVSVATSPKQEETSEIYVQTSPHLLEEQTKVPEIEEVHEQVQTSPPISLEEEKKKVEPPKAEECHTEMQTSPLSTLDVSMQTVPEEVPEKPSTQHSEMQTCPLSASDFGAQAVTEEPPEIEETSTQTMETVAKKVEEYAVQTSPIEDVKEADVPIETEETQVRTVATDVVSIEAQTSPTPASTETETQTAEKTVVAVEQQTTPPPSEEKVLTGMATQTVAPEAPRTVETEAQTSKPGSPEVATLDFNVQADLTEQRSLEAMETQTTPEESPRQVDTQETESQTMSPEPTQEMMIQTSPVTFAPEKVEVCELSSQTSLEEKKQSMDEQSQTVAPERIETSDSSVQIKTSELVAHVEECVQIIPETRERDAQTIIDEEKPLLVTVSQQTNGVSQVPEEEKVAIEDEEGNVIDVVDGEVTTPLKLTEIPVAPDVQVQETKDTTKIEEVIETASVAEESVKEEELKVAERLQSLSERAEETEESTADPSMEDTETANAEFEIRLQATIEFPTSDTTADTTSKLSYDSSQDTTVTEDTSSGGKVDDSVGRRQKRKRRHKTIEISATSDKDLESIFGQPIESRDVSLRLSYSDVAKRNVGKEKSPPGEAGLDRSFEEDDVRTVAEEKVREIEENVQSVGAPFTTTEPVAIRETQDVWALGKDQSEGQQTPVVPHMPSPEPMDTTEEPLSPVGSMEVLQEADRPRIKTYADIISESSKKPERDQSSWELSHHAVSQKGASSKAFLLAEAAEYEPQHQTTQSSQTTKAISDRMQNLRNAKQPSHLGNILHIAHLDKIANEKQAEERAAEVRKELSHLRDAAQEKDAITVEDTLIVVVDTISTWLETIEYRIFLSKECPTGPSHDDKTYVELKDEVENVEENIHELNNIWKLVEANYPGEDRSNLQECLDALMNQVRMIEDATDDGEKHLTSELARWDEFVNGVNNMYRCDLCLNLRVINFQNQFQLCLFFLLFI